MGVTYFDNAATSHPKPDCVLEAIVAFCESCGASPGRGAYREAIEASDVLRDARSSVAELAGAGVDDHVIFTLNCSDSLNLAIVGTANYWARRGEAVHVVTTAMDHNSVLRPLRELAGSGVTTTIVAADAAGVVDPGDIAAAIDPETRLVAVAHGSNVCGSVQDVEAIAAACRSRGVPLLVDAAQTLGHWPIDVSAMEIDLLAFPGHKGLLGPLGTGGLVMRSGSEATIAPLRCGGTGSESDADVQPRRLPDRYEPGSHNMVGIAGLAASTRWILEIGVDALHARQQALIGLVLELIGPIAGVRLVGPVDAAQRVGVFSLVFEGRCPLDAALALEHLAGIRCRAGLHCAPHAHGALGTDTIGGTVRCSLGPFHDQQDIERLIDAVARVASGRLEEVTA